MINTSKEKIEALVASHRLFFNKHQTKSVDFRIEGLKKLKSAIVKNETRIADALHTDLHKSFEEAYLTEISIVLAEIEYHLKKIKQWVEPQKVSTPMHLLPSSSQIIFEPLGLALIIAPWNYPFQLVINPLVGAISAGCCAIVKPSPYTPSVAKVIEEILSEIFDENYISVVQGDREVNTFLLEQKTDVIFFTGSPALGKVVMTAAAQHLTPVILELGGKSPCIVDADANLDIAAKRIMWGKCINAGQTCIAPDYIFVHETVKEELIEKMKLSVHKIYGEDIQQNKYYPRIVNKNAFTRLSSYLKTANIRFGGESEESEKYIAPTVVDNIDFNSPIMQDEIFGPILPIISFTKIEDAISYINKNEKPLAFYYFGNNKNAKHVLQNTSSGGGCINDTLMHIANHNLPFGGVGNSGQGKYHGKGSFLAFSNQRSIVSTPTWIDVPFKYPPFKYFEFIRKFI
jgi:aldehyde dehydrogenase (NAD+)